MEENEKHELQKLKIYWLSCGFASARHKIGHFADIKETEKEDIFKEDILNVF